MLKEFAMGDLLFTPIAIFTIMALIATIITHFILPEHVIAQFLVQRAWLNILFFICYLALFMYVFGA